MQVLGRDAWSTCGADRTALACGARSVQDLAAGRVGRSERGGMRRVVALVVFAVLISALPTAPFASTARAALIPTTTTLAVPTSPAQAWVSTTLVATVSPTPSNWTHVMFWSGTDALGDAVLDAQGHASWTRSWGFAPGSAEFRATYAGDG